MGPGKLHKGKTHLLTYYLMTFYKFRRHKYHVFSHVSYECMSIIHSFSFSPVSDSSSQQFTKFVILQLNVSPISCWEFEIWSSEWETTQIH